MPRVPCTSVARQGVDQILPCRHDHRQLSRVRDETDGLRETVPLPRETRPCRGSARRDRRAVLSTPSGSAGSIFQNMSVIVTRIVLGRIRSVDGNIDNVSPGCLLQRPFGDQFAAVVGSEFMR